VKSPGQRASEAVSLSDRSACQTIAGCFDMR
jgi:hypothetical protein